MGRGEQNHAPNPCETGKSKPVLHQRLCHPQTLRYSRPSQHILRADP